MRNRVDEILGQLVEACRRGDLVAVRDSLDVDAVAVCDGGALVAAPMDPVHGAEEVARLIAVLLCGEPDTELTVEAVNGRAGLALRRAGRAIAVIGVRGAGTKVADLWIVLNPVKLRAWHRR
jgi:hypothetical protein